MTQQLQLKLSFESLARELRTPLNIDCDCGNGKRCGNPLRKCGAIWDTGATNSMISPEVVRELKLLPTGSTHIMGVHGAQKANLYRVNLVFDCGYIIPDVEVSEAGEDCGFELLVGMDIIACGTFTLNNKNGKTIFLFEYPA